MNTDKIIAEIERLKAEKQKENEAGSGLDNVYQVGYDEACEDIINIIKTLDKEAVSDDLEEEITNYLDDHYTIKYDLTLLSGGDTLTQFDYEDIAKHFANWQREQMMKGAVDATVNFVYKSPQDTYLNVELDEYIAQSDSDLSDGSKVMVIIIKED